MKLVVLDRDGVINQEIDGRILTKEQLIPIPGSIDAITKLKNLGYTVVVATNQSIISKKLITIAELHSIHDAIQQLLRKNNVAIDKIYFCPHQQQDLCLCRKPKPGMLLEIAREFNFDFKYHKVPFVGDDIIDLLAASASGALPVLVKTGKGRKTINLPDIANIKNLLVFDDLNAFVDYWGKLF